MSAFTVESSHPVRVEASDDQPITLRNNGDTLYYKQDASVSASSNDGSLTAGASATFTVPTWIRSASASSVQAFVPIFSETATTPYARLLLASSDASSARTTLGTDASSAARTPSTHATSHQPGGTDAMAVDAAAGTGSLRTIGTGATQATAGNDARLTDTRTPTDGTVSVPKTGTGASGLAVGCFSAYRNAASSLANNVVVPFDTEEWDVSSWFDVATNVGRFTPQVAGYYRLSAAVRAGGSLSAVTKFWLATLTKNGVAFKTGDIVQDATVTGPLAVATALVQANGTTDYFEVVVQHNEAGSVALSVGASQTFFQGELIGRS